MIFNQVLHKVNKKILNTPQSTNTCELVDLKPFHGAIASSRFNINRCELNDIDKLKTTLLDKGLLVIPSHRILSDKEQLKLTSIFGEPNKKVSYITANEVSTPQSTASNKSVYTASTLWHCDNSFLKNPPRISVLQMLDNVHVKWESHFVNLYDLYAKMDMNLKIKWKTFKIMYASSDVIHPLFWIHPYSGKPSLYFDFRFVNSIYDECIKSGQIELKDLNEFILNLSSILKNTKSIYKHIWCKGDIIIVDNYAISKKQVAQPMSKTSAMLKHTTAKGIYF